MKNHAGVVIGVLRSAIRCAATFLFAWYREFALVEVAASITTGVELHLLSSSMGDWIERKRQANYGRWLIAAGPTWGVILYFGIGRRGAA